MFQLTVFFDAIKLTLHFRVKFTHSIALLTTGTFDSVAFFAFNLTSFLSVPFLPNLCFR